MGPLAAIGTVQLWSLLPCEVPSPAATVQCARLRGHCTVTTRVIGTPHLEQVRTGLSCWFSGQLLLMVGRGCCARCLTCRGVLLLGETLLSHCLAPGQVLCRGCLCSAGRSCGPFLLLHSVGTVLHWQSFARGPCLAWVWGFPCHLVPLSAVSVVSRRSWRLAGWQGIFSCGFVLRVPPLLQGPRGSELVPRVGGAEPSPLSW